MHAEAQSFLWFPYNHFTLTYGVIPPALLNLWWRIIQSVPHLLLCFKPTQNDMKFTTVRLAIS